MKQEDEEMEKWVVTVNHGFELVRNSSYHACVEDTYAVRAILVINGFEDFSKATLNCGDFLPSCLESKDQPTRS